MRSRTLFRFVFQKLRVWCRVANGQWQLGKIQSTAADTSLVMLSTANVSLFVTLLHFPYEIEKFLPSDYPNLVVFVATKGCGSVY